MRDASTAAPGVSPWTQIVSTSRATRDPSIALTARSRAMADRATHNGLLILDDGTRLTARGTSVPSGLIGTVGKTSRAVRKPARCRRRSTPSPAGRTESASDRLTAVARAMASARAASRTRHVVERAVRLHVLEAHSLGGGHRRQRADLIHDEIFDLARRRSHLAASEPNEIGKPGCAPTATPCCRAKRDRLPHRRRDRRRESRRRCWRT